MKFLYANFKKSTGFTLAEVLITLGIIGVVASMTIPALINQTRNSEYKAKWKKAHSILNQIHSSMRAENEFPYSSEASYRTAFQSRVKVNSNCTTPATDCGYDTNKWFAINNKPVTYPFDSGTMILTLSDGIDIILTPSYYTNSGVSNMGITDSLGCNLILVDTNGRVLPNRVGDDIHSLFLCGDKIIPGGMQNSLWGDSATYCDRSASGGSYPNGTACSALVLQGVDY